MTEQQDDQFLVEITDEEGNVVANCEVYDIVEFEEKEYAILIPVDSKEEEVEPVVMEYYEEGEEGFFKYIEDDEEYDRVCEYIESLEEEDEEE